MTTFDNYQAPDAPIAATTVAWNMYGAGVENIGRDAQPETFAVSEPADNQLLVRVDAVGMCFSDVKLIQQGGRHPKLYNRDLASEPTRLGHEAALTVLKVGKNLQADYQPGQRLAIQPDIYQDGMSTAYGYTIPGGLTQFHVLGDEVLNADDGAYVLPIGTGMGYAETALTEPWACVEGAYTQRRRLELKEGGTLWIIGNADDRTSYSFSSGLAAPARIILTDVPQQVRELVQQTSKAEILVRDGLSIDDYAALRSELTSNQGFDDVIVLDPRSANQISAAARLVARRGTFNLVGQTALDGLPEIDVGRIHYDYIAYVGTSGPEISAAYGEQRNRCDLQPNGVAVFVGAGGPMGQMHVQRAIELPNGPRTIIATDVNDDRLQALDRLFGSLAKARGKRLVLINPTVENSLHATVMLESNDLGADDVIVSVPSGPLMGDAATLLAPNGMLVLFAGVPNGTFAPLNLSNVYLANAQFTGTSGSRISDQATVIQKTLAGELSPNRSVAAVGGIEAALDGVKAMMAGTYAGKVVIFPQLSGLPLTGVDQLHSICPDVAAKLGAGNVWNPEAEQALIEHFWRG
ncbi:alcohol dehydrogenase catalytic domain-containing protein [Herpetosiphon sp. NSE202]|uniref:alcohol dehydrogenase catalytic domain-containing protein n=1 Tax=Herpetosiphon sp. NSE202 TaxID=3351349 RepID=UPI003627641A